MNRTELVAAISNKAGMTKKDADRAVAAFTETIIQQLQEGEKVQIVGFGTFEPRKRKERTGINPRTGETIDIAESIVPAFKAGKSFKEAMK